MSDKPKVAFYWCASCGGCEEAVVDLDVVPTLNQRLVGGKVGQRRIAMLHADHRGVFSQKRGGGGRDHRVGPRGRAPGKQNGDTMKVMDRLRRARERLDHETRNSRRDGQKDARPVVGI